jgi:hypothetical protein
MSATIDRQGATTRRGFALPMAILALALITASIVAGFSATSAETSANNSLRAENRAYQLAEVGLQTFMLRRSEAGWCSNCVSDPAVADSEWSTVSLQGGYARVVALRLRPKLSDGSPALFYVIATGTDTMARLSGAGSSLYATRSVATYALFNTPGVKALGAWFSFSGITNSASGSAVPITGTDECGAASAVAGMVIPSGGQYSGSGTKPTGTPAVDSSMSIDSLKKRSGIDWNAIVNYDALPADVTIPSGTFPTNTQFNDTSYWPVIHLKQSYTIPRDGRGIIIADSNLTFSSNNVWDGIVLVGGRLISSGSDTTAGAVFSGLNRTLPGAVNPPIGTTTDNDTLRNTKRFRYNSCKIARATVGLKYYFAISNAWSDNVAVW